MACLENFISAFITCFEFFVFSICTAYSGKYLWEKIVSIAQWSADLLYEVFFWSFNLFCLSKVLWLSLFFLLLLGIVSYFMECMVTSRLCMHLSIFHVFKLFFNSQRWYQMHNCCDLLTRQARSWQYHLQQLVMGFSILKWPKCTSSNVIRNRTFQILRYCREVYVREVVSRQLCSRSWRNICISLET